MRRVIRCLGCSKIKRFSESYQVKLRERTTSIITGHITEDDLFGRICKVCAFEAGYIIKQRPIPSKGGEQHGDRDGKGG